MEKETQKGNGVVYREVGIRPASGGNGEWQVGETTEDVYEGVEYLRSQLEENGAEVYDLIRDELPEELEGANILGLIHDEPEHVVLAVYGDCMGSRLEYHGLQMVAADAQEGEAKAKG